MIIGWSLKAEVQEVSSFDTLVVSWALGGFILLGGWRANPSSLKKANLLEQVRSKEIRNPRN